MKRTKTTSFRATEQELQEMTQNATAAGMKLSNYIRSRTMNQKKPTIPETIDKLSELVAEQDAELQELRCFKDAQNQN